MFSNLSREGPNLKAFISFVLMLAFAPILNSQQNPEDIRVRLQRIDMRHAKDLDDYITRTKKVGTLVPEMAAFYGASAASLEASKKKYKDRPDLMRLAHFIEKLNERDLFGFQLLKEEIRLAAQLDSLPKADRKAWFDSRIRPLEQVEDNVVAEEVDMAVQAINQGLPLPKDIVASLKAGQGLIR